MRVGIIGAGLMGYRRGRAIQTTGQGTIAIVCDTDEKRVADFARDFRCGVTGRWEDVIGSSAVDAVIISVPNNIASTIVLAALDAGKHVLCEKPLGMNQEQAKKMYEYSQRASGVLGVGFNHRFHPGILRAKQLYEANMIGKCIVIRGRYGHGGRLGMEHEWRFQKEISGGGELLDQGVHLIDLARWFAGDFKEVFCSAQTFFWDTELEDNAFVTMKNSTVTCQFHVSVTNWKNIFSFEVFGTNGFLSIEGLGGSYGLETLTLGKRKDEFGVPVIETHTFEVDTSWDYEWSEFIKACAGEPSAIAGGFDGFAANSIIESAYMSSRSGHMTPVIL